MSDRGDHAGWRDRHDSLAPEHIAVLQWLEVELANRGLPADHINARLLEVAQQLADYALGDIVLPDIPPPPGAGEFTPWRFDENGRFHREFKAIQREVGKFTLQICGVQEHDAASGQLRSTRKLSISGGDELTAEAARQLGAAIFGDAQTMQTLDEGGDSSPVAAPPS
ncbi:MAG: hypothetical protein WBS15_11690 [Mycobacterium sp.]|uniref:hypothetical protein n=1 Tax=Mycobacterium sp. TaxID=1785 RepID=UPI003C5354F8